MPKEPYEIKGEEPTIALALDTLRVGKQALIFCNTKRAAEKTAEDISKKIKDMNPHWKNLSEEALSSLSRPTKQCRRLSGCLLKGIAFHHAGLTGKQRELIEDGFRSGKISIIASTPTLAAGLDLPAFRAIIKDLRRFGNRGLSYIPVLEYLQMAGRAGRPSYDDHGEAICFASTESERDNLVERYLRGEPEDIYSKLAVEPVLRTYILAIISSGYVNEKKDIISFFESTFWAHQFGDMLRLEMIIDKMLDLLEDWEFIIGKREKGFSSANSMSKEEFRATAVGKRVAELYLDPLTAHHLIKGIRKATAIDDVPAFSYIQLLTNTIEMRPLSNVGKKDFLKVEGILNFYTGSFLEKEPSTYDIEYDDYLKSIKNASCFHDWIEEKDEESILEEYNIRPGELKIKLDTLDWLAYASVEIARLQHHKEIIKDLHRLRIRLKNGVKEELLPLLRLKGIGRMRARKLFRNGIKDLGDVKKADYSILVSLLGKALALDVKRQLGENALPVENEKQLKIV